MAPNLAVRYKLAVIGVLGLAILLLLPGSAIQFFDFLGFAQSNGRDSITMLEYPGLRTSVQLDKRQWPDPDPFYIEFSAVPAHGVGLNWKPGHVYVTFVEHNTAGVLHSRGSFGMYPTFTLVGAGSLLFGPLPGGLKDEIFQKSMRKASQRLIVRVDRGQFERAWLVQKDWAETRVYRLVTHDCVTFMSEVAKVIGLDSPTRLRSILPFNFVEELIKRNKPNPQNKPQSKLYN
jgi:hypothetical protein